MLSFGPSLARDLSDQEASDHVVRQIELHSCRQSLHVYFVTTAIPGIVNVELIREHCDPALAAEALAIALRRLCAVHGLPVPTLPPVAPTEAVALRHRAEDLVDAIRDASFFGVVEFARSREEAVQVVVRVLRESEAHEAGVAAVAEAIGA